MVLSSGQGQPGTGGSGRPQLGKVLSSGQGQPGTGASGRPRLAGAPRGCTAAGDEGGRALARQGEAPCSPGHRPHPRRHTDPVMTHMRGVSVWEREEDYEEGEDMVYNVHRGRGGRRTLPTTYVHMRTLYSGRSAMAGHSGSGGPANGYTAPVRHAGGKTGQSGADSQLGWGKDPPEH